MAMRFRPEQHLRRQGDIRAVREEGRRIDCRAFTLWWRFREIPNDTLPARVCVIASTNAVGSAIQRNRAKRRLREIFRQQQHHVPGSCDLLLIARAAATSFTLPEMAQKFSEACERIAATKSAHAS